MRLMMATTHYRAPLDFTDESLDSAVEGSRRLGNSLPPHCGGRGGTGGEGDAGFGDAAARLAKDFAEAMDDDLNTPRALAAIEAARKGIV